jgi:orotidine-5'-phosphate decarboxylase
MHNPIIAALDVPSANHAATLAEKIFEHVGAFKIGSELFTRSGPNVVRSIAGLGKPVFLDLKFHDIPNTVEKAVESAVEMGVQMITVHTSGGGPMLTSAVQSAQGRLLVLGVTVLTSFDEKMLQEIGVQAQVADQVERLARLGVASGLQGLVCSPLEISKLRSFLPSQIQLVTPGIRPRNTAGADDQKRTMSASEAIRAGANWIVVGRPIYAAPDPKSAAQSLFEEIRVNAG